MTPVISLFALFLGCQAAPTFQGISGVTIQAVSVNGLKRTTLEQTGLREAINCLYATTDVEAGASASRLLLDVTYLIQVEDNYGNRNFELYTDRHMKGNKGHYYENLCIHEIISHYAPRK